jgi:hypothetical protein
MRLQHIIWAVGVVSLFCAMLVEKAYAQSMVGELTGMVTDAQQAVVPGASVHVKNEASGVGMSTTTNEAGLYRVQNLISGRYRIQVSHPGFKSFISTGFVLGVGQIARLDVTLEVGAVTQTVQVTAQLPLLQTESAEVSQPALQRDFEYQPNINRNFLSVVDRSALFTGSGDTQFAGSFRHGTGFYVNGAQEQRRDDSSPIDLAGPTPDIVSEVKQLINGYSAEFKGPQAILFETKSGTNEFHGSGYFYYQNSSLNANPWGATSKLASRQIEPGFTLGGPIVKNKTHFFVAYERKTTTTGNPLFLTVPTNLQRQGDFSQTFDSSGKLIPIYDPATTRASPTNPSQMIRDQFPNNVIPAARLDPVGQKFMSFYPQPKSPGTITGALNFITNQTVRSVWPQINARLDHQWNERHKTLASLVLQDTGNHVTEIFPNPGTTGAGTRPDNNIGRTYTLEHFYNPRANLVLTSSFSLLQREYKFKSTGWDKGYAAQLGLKGVDQQAHFPNTSIAGYTGLAGADWANDGEQKSAWTYSFAQRFSYAKGKHTLKFGAEVLDWRHRFAIHFSPSGTLGFGVQPTSLPNVSGTGNALAGLLVGFPMSGTIDDVKPDRLISAWWLAGYLQEDWKVSSKLTVNLGLRWEGDTANRPRVADSGKPYFANFEQNCTNPVSNTPGCIVYAGSGGWDSVWQPSYKHFQPRVGIAWQVTRKTVVRANSGIFYRNPMGGYKISGVWELGAYGLPGYISAAFTSPDNGITAPFLLQDGFPAPASEAPGPGFGAVPIGQRPRLNITTLRSGHDPFAYDIDSGLEIQHQLTPTMTAEIGYISTLGRHVYNYQELNQVLPSEFAAGNAQLRRPYPQYGNVTLGIARGFTSGYNGLYLQTDKRFSHGLTFNGSYVFQKMLTDFMPWNAYDFKSAKEDLTPHQKFVFQSVYDLPWGPNQRWLTRGLLSRIVGGWNTAGVFTWVSGTYLDAMYFTDTTNGFIQGNQGLTLLSNPNLASNERTMTRWFDTGAFAPPAPYTFGNAGRTLIAGPGSWGLDSALTKQFKFTERYSFEFKTDFANMLNHPNLTNPNTTLGSPTFGIISSKSGNRRIQFGFRFLF